MFCDNFLYLLWELICKVILLLLLCDNTLRNKELPLKDRVKYPLVELFLFLLLPILFFLSSNQGATTLVSLNLTTRRSKRKEVLARRMLPLYHLLSLARYAPLLSTCHHSPASH